MSIKSLKVTALVAGAAFASLGGTAGAQGVYVGAFGAGTNVDLDIVEIAPPPPDTGSASLDGAMGGVVLGYDFGIAPQWLVGVAGDISFGNLDTT